ncbi:MAG: hypothetical protein DWQ06_06280 [Calditrichaeota bacterium]|nr:MAG: hypothetical protein DWQ06_06280 [Calditrichota bacterium]
MKNIFLKFFWAFLFSAFIGVQNIAYSQDEVVEQDSTSILSNENSLQEVVEEVDLDTSGDDVVNQSQGVSEEVESSDFSQEVVMEEPQEPMTKLDSLSLKKLLRLKVKLAQEMEELRIAKDTLKTTSITNLEKFWKENPNTIYREDILIRLAELYIQKEKDDNFKRREEYMNRLNEDPNFDAPFPKERYDKSIELLKKFEREFPKSKNIDKAYYNLAYLTTLVDSKDRGRDYYKKILPIKESDYYIEALMALGNYYFEIPDSFENLTAEDIENRVRQSISYYENVLEFRDSRRYVEALYRLGWAHYKLRELPEAVGYFTILLDDVNEYKDYPDRVSRDRKLSVTTNDFYDDALTYLAISFTNDSTRISGTNYVNEFAFKGPDGVKEFLETAKNTQNENEWKSYGADVFLRIGDEYQKAGQGFQIEASTSYTYLLEYYPFFEQAPKVQRNIIVLESSKDPVDNQALYAAKKDYFAKYVNENAPWVIRYKDSEDPEIRAERRKVAEQLLAENVAAAADLVSKDEENVSEDDERFLIQAITDYFAGYPDGYRGPLFQQFMGVTLNTLGEKKTAFDTLVVMAGKFQNYEDIKYYSSIEDLDTEKYRFFPTDSLRYLATIDAVAYSQELMELAQKSHTSLSPPDTTSLIAENDSTETDSLKIPVYIPEPLLVEEIDFLSAVDTLVAYFPGDTLLPKLVWNSGLLFYNRNEYEKAIAKFDELILEHPYDSNVIPAKKNIIESYYRLGQFGIAGDKIRALVAENVLSDEEKSDVLGRLVNANVENSRVDSNYVSAAEKLLVTVEDFPEYDKIGIIILNAAEKYRLAAEASEKDSLETRADSLYFKVVDTYDILINNYPEDDNTKTAYQNKAYIYANRLEESVLSAETYEAYCNKYPDDEKTPDFLIEARANYEKAEKYDDAIRVSNQFVQAYPNDERANPILFGNAEFFLKLNDFDAANEIYEAFAIQFPDDPLTVKVYYDRGIYFREQKFDEQQAFIEFQNAVDRNKELESRNLPGNPFYAGEALYEITEKELSEYLQLDFQDPNLVDSDIRRKIELRDELNEKYNYLYTLSIRRRPKAAYGIALIQDDFALKFSEQAIPENISNYAAKKVSISNESFVFFDASVQNYKSTLTILKDLVPQYQESRETQMSAIDSTSTEQMKAIGIIDSAIVDANNFVAQIEDRLPGMLYQTAEVNYGTIETLLKYEDVVKQFESSRKRNKYISYVSGKDAYIYTPEQNFGIRAVSDQVIGLHLLNLSTLDSLEIQNEWNQKSRDRIIEVARISPKEYFDLANEIILEVKKEVELYETSLNGVSEENVPKGVFEVPVYIPIYLTLIQNNYSLALESYQYAYTIFNENGLTSSSAREMEEEMNKYAYELGVQLEEFGRYYKSQVKYTEGKYFENDFPEWSDASINFGDWQIQVKDLARNVLESTYNLNQDNNLALNTYTGKIIKELINISPSEFKDLVDVEENTMIVETDLSGDWKIFNKFAEGYSSLDFDDYSWTSAVSGADWSQDLVFPDKELLTLSTDLWSGTTNIWKKIITGNGGFETVINERFVDTILTVWQLEEKDTLMSVADTVWVEESGEGTESFEPQITERFVDTTLTVWQLEEKDSLSLVTDTLWLSEADSLAEDVYSTEDGRFYQLAISEQLITVTDSIQVTVDTSFAVFDTTFVPVEGDVELAEGEFLSTDGRKYRLEFAESIVTVFDSVASYIDTSFTVYDTSFVEIETVAEGEESFENAVYFRKKFYVEGVVTSAKVFVTGDDNTSIFFNGPRGRYDRYEKYDEETGEDIVDWMFVEEIDVTQSVISGENILSAVVTDLDSTGHGFQMILEVKTIPDVSTEQIEAQIESGAEVESGAEALTPEQEKVMIRRNLIFDKNRLPE